MTKTEPIASVFVEPDPEKGGDVYKWAMEQAALILDRRFDEIDVVNVADEIESVGKSEFRSLESNVEVVLIHLLKWDHQPTRRSRSWVLSIAEHRGRVSRDLAGSPSLKSRLGEAIQEGYRLSRYVAARETKLCLSSFPETCPYDWTAIMMRDVDLDETE